MYDNKSEVLQYMSVLVGGIIQNSHYGRLYDPLDDAVRNRGCTTLISPLYIGIFSRIFKLAILHTNNQQADKTDDIPDKGVILQNMRKDMKPNHSNVINEICKIIGCRLPT